MFIAELFDRLPALINKTANVDGIQVSINTNEKNASVYASSDGRRLGYAEFDRDGNVMVPYDLAVDDKYRGQGIAAVIYDYVKSLGFTIKASAEQTDAGKYFWSKNRGSERVWESELDEIARIPDDYYAGGKESLPIKPSATKSQIKPLPGGSGFGYYTRETPAGIIIYMVDPNKPAEQRDNKNDIIVAMLSLEKCQWIPGSYVVGSVTTDEAYRGRGLGHSLYGIALSILGLTLVSGTEQTSGGRSIWKIISNFPGVDIKGYTKATDNQTKQLLKQNGAQPLAGDYWTFPIKQGKHELKSTIPDVPTYHTQFAKDVPHHKIYRTGLIAKWNSGQSKTVNEVTMVPSVAKSKREHLDVMPNDGRPIPEGQESEYLGNLVAEMGRGLQLWSWQDRGTVTYYVFNTETRTCQLGTTGRPYKTNRDSFVVQGTYSGPKNTYRAADLYAFLIFNRGLTLVSDNKQSTGGYRVWQELERRYGRKLNIHGFDTKTNEPVNVTTRDEPDTHVARADIKKAGPKMKQELASTSRDLRFVASAK